MTAPPALLLEQDDLLDRHPFVDRLEHVVEGQRGNGRRGERLPRAEAVAQRAPGQDLEQALQVAAAGVEVGGQRRREASSWYHLCLFSHA